MSPSNQDQRNKIKVDWPSWISATFVVCATACAVGGFLFNQRVVPKEKETESRFIRNEKEIEKNYKTLQSQIKELKDEVEEKDEKREVGSKKQLEVLHSIDLQLVKFNLGFENMKEDIKELKDKIKRERD